MLAVKISTSLTSFAATTIICCSSVFADSNYTAIIQKISVRKYQVADNIIKISSKTNILELADTIGSTINNQKFLPKISFSLGSIPFKTLEKSLKAKGIKATYSQYNCLSMRSQDDSPINLGISASPNRNHLQKSILPFLIVDRSFLAQGKPGGRSTGQTNKCQYLTINPAHFQQGDRNLTLNLSKQGYMSRGIGFKVVAINKMQPVLKFDDANLTLEDETFSETFEFFIEGGSQELREQIANRITKKYPKLHRFISNQSVSEILESGYAQIQTNQTSRVGICSSCPDYIVKLNVYP